MKFSPLLLVLISLLSIDTYAQPSLEDMMGGVEAEIDSLSALESPITLEVKLLTDLTTPSNNDGMELTLDFSVVKVFKGTFEAKTIKIFMAKDRAELIEIGYKKGDAFAISVIRHFELDSVEPGGTDMEVKWVGDYIELTKN